MRSRNLVAIGATVLMTMALAACSKSSAGTQDAAITQAVENKLNADPSLQGDNIKASTENGVVTLTGSVSSNAARAAAAKDAQVQGVTEVSNEIATTTAVGNTPAASGNQPSTSRRRAASGSEPPAAPAAPAPPATVELSAGRVLAVRLGQPLSSKTAQAGQTWQGTVSAPVRMDGQVVVPQGAAVSGTIVAADSAGHFKGRSRLVLRLTELQFNGESYDLASRERVFQTTSRGNTTAQRVGIGAAIGGVIGAIAGGGKGAAIGAGAGAGTGTAVQAFTNAPEVNLAAETVLDFTLSAPVKVVPAAGN
ncbi:MAG: BON domain-containing protein [Acidobacteria bacterium]|nr:MAG: BON domain-containing protein [Acidobacteriota bacterium]